MIEKDQSYQISGELAGEGAILVQPNCQRTRLLVRTWNQLLRSNDPPEDCTSETTSGNTSLWERCKNSQIDLLNKSQLRQCKENQFVPGCCNQQWQVANSRFFISDKDWVVIQRFQIETYEDGNWSGKMQQMFISSHLLEVMAAFFNLSKIIAFLLFHVTLGSIKVGRTLRGIKFRGQSRRIKFQRQSRRIKFEGQSRRISRQVICMRLQQAPSFAPTLHLKTSRLI